MSLILSWAGLWCQDLGLEAPGDTGLAPLGHTLWGWSRSSVGLWKGMKEFQLGRGKPGAAAAMVAGRAKGRTVTPQQSQPWHHTWHVALGHVVTEPGCTGPGLSTAADQAPLPVWILSPPALLDSIVPTSSHLQPWQSLQDSSSG